MEPENPVDGALSIAEFDDAALADLSRVRELRKLTVQSGMTDAGLAVAGTLVELEQLAFAGAAVTGVGLRAIAGLPRLKTLVISCDDPLTDGLPALAELPSLSALFFLSDSVSLTDLPPLPQLTHLRGFGGVDDPGVFSRHPKLVDVTLKLPDGAEPLTLLETLPLRRALPNLTVNGSWHAPKLLDKLEAKARAAGA